MINKFVTSNNPIIGKDLKYAFKSSNTSILEITIRIDIIILMGRSLAQKRKKSIIGQSSQGTDGDKEQPITSTESHDTVMVL